MIQMGRIKGYLATFFQKNKSGGVFVGQGIVHYEEHFPWHLTGRWGHVRYVFFRQGTPNLQATKLSRIEPDKMCQLMTYTTFAI